MRYLIMVLLLTICTTINVTTDGDVVIDSSKTVNPATDMGLNGL